MYIHRKLEQNPDLRGKARNDCLFKVLVDVNPGPDPMHEGRVRSATI